MLISAFFRVIIEKWGGGGGVGRERTRISLVIFYLLLQDKKIRSDNGKMLIRSGILFIRLTLARSGLYCVCFLSRL